MISLPKLHAAHLAAVGAGKQVVTSFRRLFPLGMEVTGENVDHAFRETGLRRFHLVELLDPIEHKAFKEAAAPALAQWRAAESAAFDTFEKVRTPGVEKLDEHSRRAFVAYDLARIAATTRYVDATDRRLLTAVRATLRRAEEAGSVAA